MEMILVIMMVDNDAGKEDDDSDCRDNSTMNIKSDGISTHYCYYHFQYYYYYYYHHYH